MKEDRFGTILSAALHLLVLGACAVILREPFSVRIVAAGEGQGSGDGVIEVGVVDAGQLGLTQPRSVSLAGEAENQPNNELIETVLPKPDADSEVLPSTTPQPKKPDERARTTDRPTANQSDQLVTQQPLRGGSKNTSVDVGRSYGSPVPAMTSGVGVGSGANLGAGGVPGGSEYGRRIQLILSRNYNPPAISDLSGAQYVIVQLRIGRDGRILSLVNGRLSPGYVKRRSANDLINYAAERAVIASNPLPPFPGGFLIGAQEAVAEIWFRYPK